jgi:hypothetical protein
MPRDLRGGGPADAGAGKTYDVDPAAVERLKAHIAAKQAAPPVASPPAVPAVRRRAEPEPAEAAPALPEPADPATLYPTAVIAAAKEQEQANGRRNLAKVLTDDVLAIWDRWNNDGMSMNAISQKTNNGLIELAQSEVGRYLRRYRERLDVAQLDAFPEPVTETAAPPTSPGRKAVVVKKAVIAEPETAVVEPQPEPEPAADVRAQTPAPEPAAPVIEPAPETTPVTVEAETPLPKPEIEALETAVAPFAPQRPENLPPWLDRQWAPPPAPRPGDALATLAALVNDQSLRIRGSVKLNLEIEFGD